MKVKGEGTKAKPWQLTTPPGSSEFTAYRDGDDLVVQVGTTQLRYSARCIEDLHAMLKAHGPPPKTNPVKGWYGTKKGFRGRFGMYVPPVLEALGLAEVEHAARNNRMRAL